MPVELALAALHNSAVPMAATSADAAAEIAHLRSLLEKQPSCLMRVRADGTLLAVSDTALSLLGASELAQVLDANLMDHLPGEAVAVWSDFVRRVMISGTASAECEMTDLAGARRSVVLAGVALRSHPDGLESLLVTARDVSGARRLEASLQEQDGLRQSIEELRAKLADALADRQQIEGAAADRGQLQLALDQATVERQQLRSALDQAASERQQVRGALDQAALERQQLRAALDEAVAERQQLAHTLEQMVAERDELEIAARDRDVKRQRLFAEHVAGRMKAEQALADARIQLEQLISALTAVTNAASEARLVLGTEVQK
jgi:hypothetical protein